MRLVLWELAKQLVGKAPPPPKKKKKKKTKFPYLALARKLYFAFFQGVVTKKLNPEPERRRGGGGANARRVAEHSEHDGGLHLLLVDLCV